MVSDIAQLLLMGVIRESAGGDGGSAGTSAGGDPALAAGTAPHDDPRTAPHGSLVPGGREITFFVIFSFAALLALLISTVWMEVRSKYLYR